eukprot:1679157-Prorocentrum_lima.AAC.1
MTSSLVGSEMCIRDRFMRTRAAMDGKRPDGSGGSPASASSLGERFGPVSYTHLTLPTICSV